jgi:hypothetical protein
VVPVAPSSARYARNVSRAGAVGGAAARRRGGESVWALAAVASRSAWGRRRIRRVGGRSALAAGSAAAPPLDRSRFLLIQAEAPILQDRMLHCCAFRRGRGRQATRRPTPTPPREEGKHPRQTPLLGQHITTSEPLRPAGRCPVISIRLLAGAGCCCWPLSGLWLLRGLYYRGGTETYICLTG